MTLGRDVRFALRALRGAPLVSILAIVCIGLGIGAVTTVYSTASAFTFRPLPQIRNADRLLFVSEGPAADRGSITVTPGTYSDLATLHEFSGVTALQEWTANIAGVDVPERVGGGLVSANFFKLAGRTAFMGRTLTDEDVALHRRVVVLSHGLWRRRFGADARVLGSTVRINGEGHVVVGIMPPDFVFPPGTDLWAPLTQTPEQAADRTTRSVFALARLAPGVTPERAAAALDVLGARIAADYATTHKGWVIRGRSAEEFFGEGPRPFMIVLLASVAFLLLIACANVANLLLVRATARRREMGLRVALGATRARLVMQLFIESLLLAIGGGVLGIAFAWLGTRATKAAFPLAVQKYIPGFGNIVLDMRALVVASIVSMVAGVVFGLVPAIVGSGVDVNTALKDAGRSESPRSRLRTLRSALVIGEIALALMLVAGAALMATTFRRLSNSDPGFHTANTLTARITLPEADYPNDSAVVRFWGRLRDELAAQPGVSSAELTNVLPMSWQDMRVRAYPEGQKPAHEEDAPSSGFRHVSTGFLRGVGVRQLAGRLFSNADRLDAPLVVVLSETAARRLLPGRQAVGQRIVLRDRVATVVGVVRDVRANPLTSNSPTSVVYVSMEQWPSSTASVVLQVTHGDAADQSATLQRVIGSLDSRLAAGEVSTMKEVVEGVTSPQSATAQMLLASAFIALVMAGVGTYGVMAYAVARRTQEIGVRVALGATAGMVVRLMMGRTARMAGFGVGIGLLGAVGLGQGMRAILFDTNPADPGVLVGAGALLGAVALVAGWLPARRATRVNPVTALRGE